MTSQRLTFVEPMKAKMKDALPLDAGWIYEVKFDGFRALAIKNNREVTLWSRNKKSLTERFSPIAAALAQLPVSRCILDGEICRLDEQGRSSFQLLQNNGDVPASLVYYAFDLLAEGNRDLKQLALIERKTRLKGVLREAVNPILSSPVFSENPGEIVRVMEAAGVEGVIAKLENSFYEPGRRSGAWIKIKFHKGQEFVVIGYTLPKRTRKYFGALLLGYYRGKRLVYAGRVGTGFNEHALRDLYGKLKPLENTDPPFDTIPESSSRWRQGSPSDNRWVQPKLVVEIRFTEWTEDGLLRHPSFRGVRGDKSAASVRRDP